MPKVIQPKITMLHYTPVWIKNKRLIINNSVLSSGGNRSLEGKRGHLFQNIPCFGILLGSEASTSPADLVRLMRSCVGLAAEVCSHLGKASLALDLYFNPSSGNIIYPGKHMTEKK